MQVRLGGNVLQGACDGTLAGAADAVEDDAQHASRNSGFYDIRKRVIGGTSLAPVH
jgi:hypothetical protein